MFNSTIKLSFNVCLFILMAANCVSKASSFPTHDSSPCNCVLLQSCDAFNAFIDTTSNESHVKAVIQEAVCHFDGYNIFVCCPVKLYQKRFAKDKPQLDYIDELTGLNCPPSFGKEYDYDEYLKSHHMNENDFNDNTNPNNDRGDDNDDEYNRNIHSRVVCDDWNNCNTFTFPNTDEHHHRKTSHKHSSHYHGHDHDHDYNVPFFPNYHSHSHHHSHDNDFPTEPPTTPSTISINEQSNNCGMLSQASSANRQVYPWITRLAYLNTTSRTIRYRCMGTIITDQHILTAAHCVDKLVQNLRLIYVRVGDDLVFEDFKIMETTVHPNYNEPLFNNDVALIRLAKRQQTAVSFTSICLPQIDSVKSMGNTGVVAGWSNSETSTMESSTIRYINLPIMNNTECAIRYAQYSEKFENSIVITPTEFCAQAEAMNDVCEGDSGGPFMDLSKSGRYTLLGIVAFGPKTNCGQSNLPGVYMRVSSYVEWIRNNIK